MTLSNFKAYFRSPQASGLTRGLVLTAGALLTGLCLVGCKPDYPKCETDEHCSESEEGKKESKLMCVNGMCQQCRQDSDCGDPSQACNAGLCERIPGYCAAVTDCSDGEKCEGNRCKPECASDAECGDGQRCEGTKCVAKSECSADADCGPGMVCEGDKCVTDPNANACSLITVYFSYDSSVLSPDSRSSLDQVASCIKEKQYGSIQIAGHTDENGSEEYNIALGERRAKSVREYLKRLGVKSSALKTISYGEESPQQSCG